MASLRKRYSTQVETSDKVAPTAATPIAAAEPPPPADDKVPTEPPKVDEPGPVENASQNALKQRLAEMQAAQKMVRNKPLSRKRRRWNRRLRIYPSASSAGTKRVRNSSLTLRRPRKFNIVIGLHGEKPARSSQIPIVFGWSTFSVSGGRRSRMAMVRRLSRNGNLRRSMCRHCRATQRPALQIRQCGGKCLHR